MKRKIDAKTLKTYKRYLRREKYKNLVLSTTIAGMVFGTPVVMYVISSFDTPEEEMVQEEVIKKEIFSAVELEKKASSLYFFDANMYAAAVTNTFAIDHINSDFKIANSLKGIQAKEVIAYDEKNDINVVITATDKYFSLEYKEPSLTGFHDYEITNYTYSNDRTHAYDLVSHTYTNENNRLRISKSSEIDIKKNNVETNIIWYIREISAEEGSIELFLSPIGSMSVQWNGQSLKLNKDEYELLLEQFELAENNSLDVSYKNIKKIFDELAERIEPRVKVIRP